MLHELELGSEFGWERNVSNGRSVGEVKRLPASPHILLQGMYDLRMISAISNLGILFGVALLA
jgi:hypothetical protein